MRRKERAVSEAEARSILEHCQYAALATVNPEDGSPYCVPVSPVPDGNIVYIHCAPEGRKLVNLAACDRVCLTAVGNTELVPEHFTTRYESAIVFGRGVLVTDESEKIRALKLICEKYAASNLAAADAAIQKSLHRTAVLRIDIEEISGKAKR